MDEKTFWSCCTISESDGKIFGVFQVPDDDEVKFGFTVSCDPTKVGFFVDIDDAVCPQLLTWDAETAKWLQKGSYTNCPAAEAPSWIYRHIIDEWQQILDARAKRAAEKMEAARAAKQAQAALISVWNTLKQRGAQPDSTLDGETA